MTIEELLTKMSDIKLRTESRGADTEQLHEELDELLLEYIGNKEVTELFREIDKWYA